MCGAMWCISITVQYVAMYSLLQEVFLEHPFHKILSTRRYVNDSGIQFLDIKVGDLMVHRILRIESDQVGYLCLFIVDKQMYVMHVGEIRQYFKSGCISNT